MYLPASPRFFRVWSLIQGRRIPFAPLMKQGVFSERAALFCHCSLLMIEMVFENLLSINYKLGLKTDIADAALFKTANIAVIKAKGKHVNSFITCLPI